MDACWIVPTDDLALESWQTRPELGCVGSGDEADALLCAIRAVEARCARVRRGRDDRSRPGGARAPRPRRTRAGDAPHTLRPVLPHPAARPSPGRDTPSADRPVPPPPPSPQRRDLPPAQCRVRDRWVSARPAGDRLSRAAPPWHDSHPRRVLRGNLSELGAASRFRESAPSGEKEGRTRGRQGGGEPRGRSSGRRCGSGALWALHRRPKSPQTHPIRRYAVLLSRGCTSDDVCAALAAAGVACSSRGIGLVPGPWSRVRVRRVSPGRDASTLQALRALLPLFDDDADEDAQREGGGPCSFCVGWVVEDAESERPLASLLAADRRVRVLATPALGPSLATVFCDRLLKAAVTEGVDAKLCGRLFAATEVAIEAVACAEAESGAVRVPAGPRWPAWEESVGTEDGWARFGERSGLAPFSIAGTGSAFATPLGADASSEALLGARAMDAGWRGPKNENWANPQQTSPPIYAEVRTIQPENVGSIALCSGPDCRRERKGGDDASATWPTGSASHATFKAPSPCVGDANVIRDGAVDLGAPPPSRRLDPASVAPCVVAQSPAERSGGPFGRPRVAASLPQATASRSFLVGNGSGGDFSSNSSADLVDALVAATRTFLGEMGLPADTLSAELPILETGLDSIDLLRLTDVLAAASAIDVPPTAFFDHPNLSRLAAWMERERHHAAVNADDSRTSPTKLLNAAGLSECVENIAIAASSACAFLGSPTVRAGACSPPVPSTRSSGNGSASPRTFDDRNESVIIDGTASTSTAARLGVAAIRSRLPEIADTSPAPPPARRGLGDAVRSPLLVIATVASVLPGGSVGDALSPPPDAPRVVPGWRWDVDERRGGSTVPTMMPHARFAAFVPRNDVVGVDGAIFGLGGAEAIAIDPQQRIVLRLAVEAMANSASPFSRLRDTRGERTTVAVGASYSEYAALSETAGRAEGHGPGPLRAVGGSLSVIAGRLSYVLDLAGPAIVVDTACSGSLVAVHAAARELQVVSGRDHCELSGTQCQIRPRSTRALAGGVNLSLLPSTPAAYAAAGMLSPAGRCQTLDESADGYVRAEGASIARLERAENDRTSCARPVAVLAGTATNQDGRSSSLTAPNGPAQEMLIREALHDAQLAPDALDALSMHGTGTALGDPIEMSAAASATFDRSLSLSGSRKRPLEVAATKTSRGHAEPCSGALSLDVGISRLRQAASDAFVALRNLNALVAGALRRACAAVHAPRQNGPGAMQILGASAFAFQVRSLDSLYALALGLRSGDSLRSLVDLRFFQRSLAFCRSFSLSCLHFVFDCRYSLHGFFHNLVDPVSLQGTNAHALLKVSQRKASTVGSTRALPWRPLPRWAAPISPSIVLRASAFRDGRAVVQANPHAAKAKVWAPLLGTAGEWASVVGLVEATVETLRTDADGINRRDSTETAAIAKVTSHGALAVELQGLISVAIVRGRVEVAARIDVVVWRAEVANAAHSAFYSKRDPPGAMHVPLVVWSAPKAMRNAGSSCAALGAMPREADASEAQVAISTASHQMIVVSSKHELRSPLDRTNGCGPLRTLDLQKFVENDNNDPGSFVSVTSAGRETANALSSDALGTVSTCASLGACFGRATFAAAPAVKVAYRVVELADAIGRFEKAQRKHTKFAIRAAHGCLLEPRIRSGAGETSGEQVSTLASCVQALRCDRSRSPVRPYAVPAPALALLRCISAEFSGEAVGRVRVSSKRAVVLPRHRRGSVEFSKHLCADRDERRRGSPAAPSPWRIAGGGALGVLVARCLAGTSWASSLEVLSRSVGRAFRLGWQAISTSGWNGILRLQAFDLAVNSDGRELRHGTISVVHAGGILATAPLSGVSPSLVRAAWAPKAIGAANPAVLGGASAGQPIERALLFGSVASLISPPGSSAYAAPNAALNVVALRHRHAGVCVCTVEWGAWDVVGMVADNAAVRAAMVRSGLGLLRPEAGLTAFARAVTGASASNRDLVAIPFEWSRLASRAPEVVGDALFAAEIEAATLASADDGKTGHKPRLPAVETARTPSNPLHPCMALPDALDVLRSVIEHVVGVAPPSPLAPLHLHGVDSLSAAEFARAAGRALGVELAPTLAFDYPSLQAIAEHAIELSRSAHVGESAGDRTPAGGLEGPLDRQLDPCCSAVPRPGPKQACVPPISALVVASCCARVCREGTPHGWHGDACKVVPHFRWDLEDATTPGARRLGARFSGFLDDVDVFDALAFGIAPNEAALMDPQQRLCLEAVSSALLGAWGVPGASALEPSQTSADVPVIHCQSFWDYAALVDDRAPSIGGAYRATGRCFSVGAGRISFTFGFDGPALAVDSACSSSLVALHLLRTTFASSRPGGRGLATAALLTLDPRTPAMLAAAGMLAPDGRCKTLDASADGYSRGEAAVGLAAETLSGEEPSVELTTSERWRNGSLEQNAGSQGSTGRSSAAFASMVDNKDCTFYSRTSGGRSVCLAVVGSATNQDGRSSSLTAPRGPSQTAATRAALEVARAVPSVVGSSELHGTGTPLGDPIEVAALLAALPMRGKASAAGTSALPVSLLASKPDRGHAEPAAGLVGLIHSVEATLMSCRVSPLRRLAGMNPHVSATLLRPGRSSAGVRIARQDAPAIRRGLVGISGFAFQGTNAHVVVDACLRSSDDGRAAATAAARCTFARGWCQPFAGVRHWAFPVPGPLVLGHRVGSGAIRLALAFGSARWAHLRQHRVRGKALVPGTALVSAALEACEACLKLGGPSGEGEGSPSLFGSTIASPLLIPPVGERLLAEAMLDRVSGRVTIGSVQVPGWRGRTSLQARSGGALDTCGTSHDAITTRVNVAVNVISPFAAMPLARRLRSVAAVAARSPNAPDEAAATPAEMDAATHLGAILDVDAGREPQVPVGLGALLARRPGCDRGVAGLGLATSSTTAVENGTQASDAATDRRSTFRVLGSCMVDLISKALSGRLPARFKDAELLVCVRAAPAGGIEGVVETRTKMHPAALTHCDRDSSGEFSDAFWVSPSAVGAGWAASAGLQALAAGAGPAQVVSAGIERRVPLGSRDGPSAFASAAPRRFSVAKEATAALLRTARLEDLLRDPSLYHRHQQSGGTFWFAKAGRVSSFDRLTTRVRHATVVTGTAGGVGGLVLVWMCLRDSGSRAIALSRAGRHAVPERVLGAGGAVRLASCDVGIAGDDGALDALGWERFFSTPTVSVLHASGAASDAMVPRQRPSSVRLAMGAKVPLIERLTSLSRPLPFASCAFFSSATAVLGNAGQSSYAAANGALDAQARLASERGLPAVSLQWGPWGAVGMASRLDGLARRLERDGLRFMSPVAGLRVLERIHREHTSAIPRGASLDAVLLAGTFDWAALHASRPDVAATPETLFDAHVSSCERGLASFATGLSSGHLQLDLSRLDLSLGRDDAHDGHLGLVQSHTNESIEPPTSSLGPQSQRFHESMFQSKPSRLRLHEFHSATASPRAGVGMEKRTSCFASSIASTPAHAGRASLPASPRRHRDREALSRSVSIAVSAALGLLPSPDAPLMSAGLDSLGAVELVSSLSEIAGAELPATFALDNPTIASIEEALVERLDGSDDVDGGDEEGGLGTADQVTVREVEGEEGSQSHEPGCCSPTMGDESIAESGLLWAGETKRCRGTELATAQPPASRGDAQSRRTDRDSSRLGSDVELALTAFALRLGGDVFSLGGIHRVASGPTDAQGLVPWNRWDVDETYAPDPAPRGKASSRFAAFLRNVELFDARFFSLSRPESENADPQLRLLLETGAEALFAESFSKAGASDGRFEDRSVFAHTGVFVGCMFVDHAELSRVSLGRFPPPQAVTGNGAPYHVGRMAFHFALDGAAVGIDTACSSSLVALHLARTELLRVAPGWSSNGRERVAASRALACGVNALLWAETSANISTLGALAPAGRCRTFEATADGYGRAEGVGCALVQIWGGEENSRAFPAESKGGEPGMALGRWPSKQPLALIRSSAINASARAASLTAPSGPAQAALISAALSDGHLARDDLRVVAVHGTGTALGDPLETGALVTALRIGQGRSAVRAGSRVDRCPTALISTKSTFGHAEGAAGVAGAAFAIAALDRRALPQVRSLVTCNPHVGASLGSALGLSALLPRQGAGWAESRSHDRSAPRFVGASSFGMSGINAHLIVEERCHPPVRHHGTLPWTGRQRFWLLPKIPAVLQTTELASPTRFGARMATRFSLVRIEMARGIAFLRDHCVQGRAVVPASGLVEAVASAAVASTRDDLAGDGLSALCTVAFVKPLAIGGPGVKSGGHSVVVSCATGEVRLEDHKGIITVARAVACRSTGFTETAESAKVHPIAATVKATQTVFERTCPFASVETHGASRGSFSVAHPAAADAALHLHAATDRTLSGSVPAKIDVVAWRPASAKAWGDTPGVAVAASDSAGRASPGFGKSGNLGVRGVAMGGSGNPRVASYDGGDQPCAFDVRGLLAARMRTPTASESPLPERYRVAWRAARAASFAPGRPERDGAFAQSLRSEEVSQFHINAVSRHAPRRGLSTALALVRQRHDLAMANERSFDQWSVVTDGASLAPGALSDCRVDAATCALLQVSAAEGASEPRISRLARNGTGSTASVSGSFGARGPTESLPGRDGVLLDAMCEFTPNLEAAVDHPKEGQTQVVWWLRSAGEFSPAVVAGATSGIGELSLRWAVEAGHPLVTGFGRLGRLKSGSSRAAVQGAGAVTVSSRDVALLGDAAPQAAGAFLFSAGGTLADGALASQRMSALRATAAAKVSVPKLATGEIPIRALVIFGSIAGTLGSPGQGCYAASNAAATAESTLRNAAGLVSMTIAWGPWAKVGMAARAASELGKSLERKGYGLLQPVRGLAILERSLAANRPVWSELVAARLIPARLVRRGERVRGLFVGDIADLAGARPRRAEKPNPAQKPGGADGALTSCDTPHVTENAVRNAVRSVVESVLGRLVPDDTPFMEAGLDSLGAIEMRTALSTALGVSLSVTAALEHPTIERLSLFAFQTLHGNARSSERDARAENRPRQGINNADDASRRGRATDAGVRVVLDAVRRCAREVLGLEIDEEAGSSDRLGIDSLGAVDLSRSLSALLGVSLPATIALEHPSIGALVKEISGLLRGQRSERGESSILEEQFEGFSNADQDATPEIPTRLPGGFRATPDASFLPRLVVHRPSAITDADLGFPAFRADQRRADACGPVPSGRWSVDAFYSPDGAAAAARGERRVATRFATTTSLALDSIDVEALRLSAPDASFLDPSARLLIETVCEAMAARTGDRVDESETGLYLGAMFHAEFISLLSIFGEDAKPSATLGNTLPFLLGRVAFALGLGGASGAVDVACSTSLVALHLAAQELQLRRSDESASSVVAGVNLLLDPRTHVRISALGALSHAGRCQSLDASADGYGRGEACIALRLACPRAGEDPAPLGVLLAASAVNVGAPRAASLTAPSGPAQTRLIAEALREARTSCGQLESPSIVSLHGTGTPLGDPIEVAALGRALPPGDSVMLQSTKTAAGHTEGAAGLASLLGAVVAVVGERAFGFSTLRTLNPYVAAALDGHRGRQIGIPRACAPAIRGRTAAASAFGMTGVNAHAIMVRKCDRMHNAADADPDVHVSWERRRRWPWTPPPWEGARAHIEGSSLASFSAPIATPRLAGLRDHVALGRAILPAVCYARLATAALESLTNAAAVLDQASPVPARLVFEAPFGVSGTEKSLSLVVDLAHGRLEVRAGAGHTLGRRHCSGTWTRLARVDGAVAASPRHVLASRIVWCRTRFLIAAAALASLESRDDDPTAASFDAALHLAGLTTPEPALAVPASAALARIPELSSSKLHATAIHTRGGVVSEVRTPNAPNASNAWSGGLADVVAKAASVKRRLTDARTGTPASFVYQSVALVESTLRRGVSIEETRSPLAWSLASTVLGKRTLPLPQAAVLDAVATLQVSTSLRCSRIAFVRTLEGGGVVVAPLAVRDGAATAAALEAAERSAALEEPGLQWSIEQSLGCTSWSHETPFASPHRDSAPTDPPHESSGAVVASKAGFAGAVISRRLVRAFVPQNLWDWRLAVADGRKSAGGLAALRRAPLRQAAGGFLQAHEVEVDVRAVGINFRDVLNVLGMYPGDPGDPGSDVAGVVRGIGTAVAGEEGGLRVGDFVFGQATGALGTCVRSGSKTLAVAPAAVAPLELAATAPTVFLTAMSCLEVAGATRGAEGWHGASRALVLRADSSSTRSSWYPNQGPVLVHSATGGLGQALLQLASALGLAAVATAGSAKKRVWARSQGVSAVLDGRSTAFASEAYEAKTTCTGSGSAPPPCFSAAIGALTSPGFVAATLSCLALGGAYVEVGKRAIFSHARVTQERPDVAYHILAVDFWSPEKVGGGMRTLAALMATGAVKPLTAALWPLGEVVPALRALGNAGHVGKIVVVAGRQGGPSGRLGGERRSTGLDGRPTLPSFSGRWLVVGGLGALGAVTCKALAEAGAKRIDLVGRRGRLAFDRPDRNGASAKGTFGSWSDLGCIVTATLGDASRTSDLAEMGAGSEDCEINRPISGVFLASGALADAPLSKLTHSHVRSVLASKLPAAQAFGAHLSLLPTVVPLAFFSSVASRLGSAGQVNYAAANGWMDGLADRLTSEGLLATSLAWGPWAGAGMADGVSQARLRRLGFDALAPNVGARLLSCAVWGGTLPRSALLACVRVRDLPLLPHDKAMLCEEEDDDGQWLTELQERKGQPMDDLESRSGRGSELCVTARKASPPAIASIVAEVAASIVGSNVASDAPLVDAGLDSLGAFAI